jgi:undecaprenyl-diphosphatase
VDTARHGFDASLADEVRRHGPSVLAGLVVAVVALVAVGAALLAVDAVVEWDERFVGDVAERRTDLGATLTEWGTWFAETVPVAVLTVATMAVAWWWLRSWAAPLFVAVAVGGEKLVYLVTSLLIGRDRPSVPTLGTTTATRSYPSGHVASATTLYGAIALLLGLAIARHWRVVALAVVAVIVAVVAVCRVYRGFHFPIDVAAGIALGIGWLSFAWARFGPELVAAHDARRVTPRGSPSPAHAPPASATSPATGSP